MKSSEKIIVSLLIGFLSIFISKIILVTIVIALYLFGIGIDKIIDQTLLQLNYIYPFVYFIIMSKIAVKNNYKDLDFIKKYISLSGIAFLLSVAMLLIIIGLRFFFLE